MDHHGPEPRPPGASPLAGSIAALARRRPTLRRLLRLHGLLRYASRTGFLQVAEARVGPLSLRFEMRDHYQREMAVGTYEPWLAHFMRAALRPADTFVDVGAQIGYTSALAASFIGPAGRVIMFEPDPRALDRLRHSLSRVAPGAPRFTLVAMAAAGAAGTVEFRIEPTLGHSRIGGRDTGAGTIRVPAVRLDDALDSHGVDRARIIKIDVEGGEVEALRGLEDRLARRAFDFVLVEKNLALLRPAGYRSAQLHALLARHGYVGFSEDRERMVQRVDLEDDGVVLENLLYARDLAAMRDVLAAIPGACPVPGAYSDGFTDGERDDLAASAVDTAHPLRHAWRLIDLARRDGPAGVLDDAESFLDREDDERFAWFRGHVAHWCEAGGDRHRALAHYQALGALRPGDETVARSIARLAGPPPGNY